MSRPSARRLVRLAVRGGALCVVTGLAGALAWLAPAGVPLAALVAVGALYVLTQAVRAGALR